MKIDLTELLQKVGNEADIQESVKISCAEDSLELTAPVKVNLHLTNTGNAVLVRGQASSEFLLACSRCLKPFRLPVNIEIDEEFSKDVPAAENAADITLKEEDFVYPIEKDNTIDLSEILRQDLLLAIPIKTLCRSDCPGIFQEKGEE